MSTPSGRHFLQIPGPTHVPDRVLRAIDRPLIDHRGPQFASLALEVLSEIRTIFQTRQPVVIYPSSGTGAWEAALVNTLSPGDRVLFCETGHFAGRWRQLAEKLGLDVETLETDWRHGPEPEAVLARLRDDTGHAIRAVCVVHNETSTGVVSRIAEIREALDRAGHPALFLVDAISSLGSLDFRMDEWGVDVAVASSQKGLMLPPGLGFNGISEKALAAGSEAGLAKSYWGWEAMLAANRDGFFPYTPATNLLFGLREAIAMLHEEGLDNVFERHRRHGEAARLAVRTWGLDVWGLDPAEYGGALTAVLVPDGSDANDLRRVILEAFDMSLGTGLARLAGRVFRIGHLGHFNDLMLIGTLAGVEMGLELAGVPHESGGVQAAVQHLGAAAAPGATVA